jgi:tetratricopeptide (TPR) repeat protein
MSTQWNHPGQAEKNSFEKWLHWSKAHQEIVAVAGIVLLLSAIGIPYYLHSQAQNEEDAMRVLNLGQMYFHQQVDPQNGPFKTDTERNQQALQAFQRIITDHAGTHTAKIARFYVARCQYFLGQGQQAYSSFDRACSDLRGTPLGEEAYFGKILCLEAQKQWAQAATIAESFLKESPNSFLAPKVRLTLADIYLQNQSKDKAVDLLKKMTETYSDSTWGKEAEHRLKDLKS